MKERTRFDDLAIAVGTGSTRRTALKALGALLIGVSVSKKVQAAPDFATRSVTLRIKFADGVVGIFKFADRQKGKLQHRGKRLILVPNIIADAGPVELAVYQQGKSGLRLVERLRLPGPTSGRLAFIAAPAAVLPNAQVAFASTAKMAEPYDLSSEDCCVNCSWGEGCGTAVCCSASNPSAGYCCDPGHCPPPCLGS